MNNEFDVFGNVQLNLNHRASVNYAKGRFAIESQTATISKSNGARAKRLEAKYKEALIDIFKGKIERIKTGLTVHFHDGSKAKY